jgi:hypothetical protein
MSMESAKGPAAVSHLFRVRERCNMLEVRMVYCWSWGGIVVRGIPSFLMELLDAPLLEKYDEAIGWVGSIW